MQAYPSEHKEIVKELLDGKFILYSDKLFSVIQDNKDFYEYFFQQSFEYNLDVRSEFIFLTSKTTTERDTRDFTIFLSLYCRELELEGQKFREQIDFATHCVEDVWKTINNSTKKEIIDNTAIAGTKGIQDFINFLKRWNRKNVINLTGNSFKFTKAVNLFFEFAVNVANEKLKKTNMLESLVKDEEEGRN
jgi:hypothetical protein